MAAAIVRRAMDAEAPLVVHEGRTVRAGCQPRRRPRVHGHGARLRVERARACCSGTSSPAAPPAQAGLQKGDVIVEIAGQSIANIYDYTYALELLKIGTPTTVAYLRGTERRTTPSLTPAARR